MYGYIYLVTNCINGKIYVGQHKSAVNDLGRAYFGSGTVLKAAYKKYGKQNFKYDILKWCETVEDLNLSEKAFIQLYNSRNPEIGYNLSPGGAAVAYRNEKSIAALVAYTKSTVWVHKEDDSRRIPKERLDEFLSHGWIEGHAPFNRSTQFKLRVSASLKGMVGVHKDSVRTKIKPELLEQYLNDGYQLGWGVMGEAHLPIKLVPIYKEGTVKHVSELKLDLYLAEGWSMEKPKKERKKAPPISEETRQKLRESHLGHKQSKLAIKKQSDSLRGRVVIHLGGEKKLVPASELETWLNAGWEKGGVIGNTTKRSKAVVCFETLQTFPTIAEAIRFCGTESLKRTLREAPSRTSGGYHWYLLGDDARRDSISQLLKEEEEVI